MCVEFVFDANCEAEVHKSAVESESRQQQKQAVREAATLCPAPCKLTFWPCE